MAQISTFKLDDIMHKWSSPHFDDVEKKSRCNMKYRMKRINTNEHKKVTKSVTRLSNPECETRILSKLLLSKTYIFIVFLMWVGPLVHDAIQFQS